MDKFTKYALLTMAIIVVVMLASAYIGHIIGGNVATDDKVNNEASGNSTYLLQSLHHRALGRKR